MTTDLFIPPTIPEVRNCFEYAARGEGRYLVWMALPTNLSMDYSSRILQTQAEILPLLRAQNEARPHYYPKFPVSLYDIYDLKGDFNQQQAQGREARLASSLSDETKAQLVAEREACNAAKAALAAQVAPPVRKSFVGGLLAGLQGRR